MKQADRSSVNKSGQIQKLPTWRSAELSLANRGLTATDISGGIGRHGATAVGP